MHAEFDPVRMQGLRWCACVTSKHRGKTVEIACDLGVGQCLRAAGERGDGLAIYQFALGDSCFGGYLRAASFELRGIHGCLGAFKGKRQG